MMTRSASRIESKARCLSICISMFSLFSSIDSHQKSFPELESRLLEFANDRRICEVRAELVAHHGLFYRHSVAVHDGRCIRIDERAISFCVLPKQVVSGGSDIANGRILS